FVRAEGHSRAARLGGPGGARARSFYSSEASPRTEVAGRRVLRLPLDVLDQTPLAAPRHRCPPDRGRAARLGAQPLDALIATRPDLAALIQTRPVARDEALGELRERVRTAGAAIR